MEFSLILSDKSYAMFLFNFCILYINSEDFVLAVTVEVKGPYEYLTLEEYPLMIVSELIFLTLTLREFSLKDCPCFVVIFFFKDLFLNSSENTACCFVLLTKM